MQLHHQQLLLLASVFAFPPATTMTMDVVALASIQITAVKQTPATSATVQMSATPRVTPNKKFQLAIVMVLEVTFPIASSTTCMIASSARIWIFA